MGNAGLGRRAFVPPAGDRDDAEHRGSPEGRKRPFGARRIGGLPGEGRESRGQRPLAPAAEANPEAVRVSPSF